MENLETFITSFEEQVQKNAIRTAIGFNEKKLSYGELNLLTNRLAHYLIQNNVEPEGFIGLYLDRSELYLIGLIGVLKAGATFVPFLPDSPRHKQQSILEDLCPRYLLVTSDKLKQAESLYPKENIIVIEDILLQSSLNSCNPELRISGDNLAYIIFTSGSTGKPKGAMIEHKGMLNHLLAKIKDLDLTHTDNVAQIASQVFDISIWQYLAPLLTGGKVTVYENSLVWDPYKLLPGCENDSITILECVPSHARMILDVVEEKEWQSKFAKLRWLLLTGEALPANYCKRWFENFNIPIINAYGPTECSDDVTHFVLKKTPEKNWNYVPINGEIINTKIYVVNEEMELVSSGEVGELCVSGIGVGRGYLHRPELTKSKFIRNPFNTTEKHEKLYKTGDLVRWNKDGFLEFIGRNDFQVKIRGFRIEIGEIESKISEYPGIKQCFVQAVEGKNNKHLVAYYILGKDFFCKESDVKDFLSKFLPEYMIPGFFIELTEFPLTENGKIDIKRLPSPNFEHKGGEGGSPRNKIEKDLIRIWSELLGVGKIGIHDNFFSLGGDSILSIQMITRANKNGMYLAAQQLIDNQTIAELASQVRLKDENEIKARKTTGEITLTPIQRRFFEQNLAHPHHFNQAHIIFIPGFNIEKLQQTFRTIISHHDTLRVRFKYSNGKVVQYYSDDQNDFAVEVFDISAKNNQAQLLEEYCSSCQSKLNITCGPIMKASVITGHDDNNVRLFIAIHHLLIDGISWRILLEDLRTAYEGGGLQSKGSSFKDWSEEVVNYANDDSALAHYSHWMNVLKNNPRINNCQVQESNYPINVESLSVELNESLTKDLLKNCNQAYNTQINDLLLTAFALAMSDWTNSDQVVFQLEGHGRENISNRIDISRTIGWFTSLFPVLLRITKDLNHLGVVIKSVKEQLRSIPDKGISYGALCYCNNNEEVRNSLNKKFVPIIFNYYGKMEIESPDNFWEITGEKVGESISIDNFQRDSIEIDGWVLNDKLTFFFKYNSADNRNQTPNVLASNFIKYLTNVIEHCLERDGVDYTPSDFPLAGVNQEELDSLLLEDGINYAN